VEKKIMVGRKEYIFSRESRENAMNKDKKLTIVTTSPDEEGHLAHDPYSQELDVD
jgi:hypothetical protein